MNNPDQRVDLHLHSTASDGAYTPAQLVDLARRSGLAAVALTDHDTVAGLAEARAAAAGACEVVSGVEITTLHRGRTLHLLGYFFDPDNGDLRAALGRLRQHRATRFTDMAERLRRQGVSLDDEDVRAAAAGDAPGRRQLAELVVRAGRAGSVRQAFARYLGDDAPAVTPGLGLPAAEAVALVRAAGGVAGLAHPSYDGVPEMLAELRGLGLAAVEVSYPNCKPSYARRLRGLALHLGLAVTGGSDCHGPDDPRRAPGACGVTWAELELLRRVRQPNS